MATTIDPPNVISYERVDATSVRVRWRPVSDAVAYYLRGGGAQAERRVVDTTAVVRGLLPSRTVEMEIRSEGEDTISVWHAFNVRPSADIPPAPINVPIVPIIDADRQSLQMRLPRPDGTNVNIRLRLWWQTSDQGWWGSVEVPSNNPVVSSKRLGVNCGLFDDGNGYLDGNFVMRSTSDDMEVEPTRRAFRDRTHELRWEPA